MIEKTATTVEMARHLLSSINLSDIEEIKKIKLNEKELMARAGDVELFYKAHFEKVLKLFIQEQLEFMGKNTQNLEQLMFARGTINGLLLIKEWCENQKRLSLSRFKDDSEKPLTEI